MAGLERFLAGYEKLTQAARERLVVENDDRSFDLSAVLSIHEQAGTRVVWDALHHRCHNPHGIPEAEALARALDTWPPAVTPKTHYSSPRLDIEIRRSREGRRVRERIVIPPPIHFCISPTKRPLASGGEVEWHGQRNLWTSTSPTPMASVVPAPVESKAIRHARERWAATAKATTS